MRKFVKTALKVIGFGLIGLLAFCGIFLLICFINNQIQLSKKANILIPTGKLVMVKGHKMHIYSEGKGKPTGKNNLTCVFMAGLGICSPELEFKGLYRKMSDKYRIAVVDRPGYGFSEVTIASRDISIILEETRSALKLAGEKPPYVLFPHSISGLEAIYWAQKYPMEIKAIIGLDIGYPEAYVDQGIKSSELLTTQIEAFLVKCGLHRLLPSVALDDTILNSSFLSTKEKTLYTELTYRNLLNNNVLEELRSLYKNSKKSLALNLPKKTPICIFIATPLTKKEAIKRSAFFKQRAQYFNNYVSKFDKGKVISMSGKHCIYLYSPDYIAKESKIFLESITKP